MVRILVDKSVLLLPILHYECSKILKAQSVTSPALISRVQKAALRSQLPIAIRNGDNRVIGLLCINVNLDAPFSQVLQSFMPTQEANEAASSVNFASDVEKSWWIKR